MPRKTDGEKIDELKDRSANMDERLNAHARALDGLSELQEKLRDLLTKVEKDLALLNQTCDGLKEWKAEVKKEKEEASRRKAAFGPTLTAALISLVGVLINVFL